MVLLLSILSGCDFITSTSQYTDTAKQFADSLLAENYEQCLQYMALEHESAIGTNADTLKAGLANFRTNLVNNFGEKLDYSFMEAEKKFSTNEEENTPPNTTVVFIQFSNKQDFGVFKFLFDDQSKKIIHLNMLDVRQPIPSMSLFWLYGLIPLGILVFNIYVMREIKKNEQKRKWLKYLAVAFFNLPSITYNVISGLSISFFHFQIFGIGFIYMGYLNAALTFGFPLGGLYWLWKLKQPMNAPIEPEITALPTE